MTSRKPSFKAPKAMHEDFKPEIEWTDDSSNRILLVHLPGFKREEIRVQLENAGKLLVKGSRQTSENNYIDVDQSFDVPKDTIAEKITGRFEDGRLTLIMPKRVVEEQEEKQAIGEEKKEPMREEKPTETQEKPKSSEDSKDEAMRKEKLKPEEEKKDNEHVEQEKLKSVEKKKEDYIQKMKLKMREICVDKPKEIGKRISESESFDVVLEKVNRNRKLIAVAVVAFSVGFYVSHKLRTSRS